MVKSCVKNFSLVDRFPNLWSTKEETQNHIVHYSFWIESGAFYKDYEIVGLAMSHDPFR